MATLPLGAALKRGVIVTAANWPVVVVDFLLESFFKLTLTVPVLGGALMVSALAGSDLDTVIGEGLRATADLVLGALTTAPPALGAFLVALGLVGVGAESIMFVVKAGTFSILVAGERRASEFSGAAPGRPSVREAAAFSLGALLAGASHFGRRAFVLALWLGAAYVLIGGAGLLTITSAWSIATATRWMPAWPLVVLVATTTSIVAITMVNLIYDLLRVIIVTDDCGIAAAGRRLVQFVMEDARHVLGIFSVIAGVVVLATLGSLVAAAGMAIAAWMPFLGVVVLPIQILGWLLRGLGFQFMALAALSAYQTQYRRFSENRRRFEV